MTPDVLGYLLINNRVGLNSRLTINTRRAKVAARVVAELHVLPLARDGVLLEARALGDAPAAAVGPVAALAARPRAPLVVPAAQVEGARVLGLHGPGAVLVVAGGRQAVLEVEGAAGAKVPLHRGVPAGVVVRVGGAHVSWNVVGEEVWEEEERVLVVLMVGVHGWLCGPFYGENCEAVSEVSWSVDA